jgi:hypothetical protein
VSCAALAVVEELQVLKDRIGQLQRVRQRCRSSNSTCIRDQNDSTTALSKQAPTPPMEATSPEALARWLNAQEVNCTSEDWTGPDHGPGSAGGSDSELT